MKNLALLITSVISLFSVAFMYVTISENPSSEFKDYKALMTSGLIEKGWVPKYIPKSSTEIFEKHNLDTNSVTMYFKYVPTEKKLTESKCKLVIENEIGSKYICEDEGRTSILTLRNDGEGFYRS